MSNQNLFPAFDALDEAVLLVDAERAIVHANLLATQLFGEGLTGQPLVRVIRHPDALRLLGDVLGGAARAQAQLHLQVPLRTAYQLTVLPLVARQAGEPAAILSFKDVSPLLEAAQMRSDFVANVSHELRSPLTTLSGLIETLLGAASDDPEAQHRFLSIMQREAARMDRLIDDLLSLSRVEAEEKVRPAQAVDMIELVRSVMSAMAARDDFSGRELNFQTELAELQVAGDPDQLIQALQNLIENAAKYSPHSSPVTVSAELRERALGFRTPVLIISVADRGDGIAPEHIPRLQERFYRVDSGRSRLKGGTGLGLAIVKHIMQRHRGRLVIRSEVGVGTDASLLLPIIPSEQR